MGVEGAQLAYQMCLAFTNDVAQISCKLLIFQPSLYYFILTPRVTPYHQLVTPSSQEIALLVKDTKFLKVNY